MKTIKIILALICFVQISFSQQSEDNQLRYDDGEVRTLLGDVKSYGGYLGLTTGYTQIDGEVGFVTGGRLGMILNHSFTMGFAGYGFFNDYKWDNTLQSNVNLQGGYGGICIEPIVMPNFPIHLSFPIVMGVGGVEYVSDRFYYYDEWNGYVEDVDTYVLVEPGIELDLNITKFFRVSAGATYRYTSKIKLADFNSDVLHGISAELTLKFGWF